MITKMSPGYLRVQMGERTVTIEGEGLVRMEGQPDYVIYKDSIRQWDSPHVEPIDEVTKQQILHDVVLELEEQGVKVAVE